MTQALIEMHYAVAKLLNENSIIQTESEISKNIIEVVVREVLKLQDTFVSLSKSRDWNTEAIIATVKPQLEKSLGAKIS